MGGGEAHLGVQGGGGQAQGAGDCYLVQAGRPGHGGDHLSWGHNGHGGREVPAGEDGV